MSKEKRLQVVICFEEVLCAVPILFSSFFPVGDIFLLGHRAKIQLSRPTIPVQTPELNRFRKVFHFNVIACGKVGNGAGYFQDAVISSR